MSGGGWSRASHAHYQMGRSGATLSFYDWPLITAALKAARFFSDTSSKRARTAKWTYLSVLFKSFTRFDGRRRELRTSRWFVLQSAGCFAI